MANEPAVKSSEVRYQIEGREIILTPDIVRKYLVRGKGELATAQEVAFFLGMCRARELDPFAGDCYLVKYDQTPAAIITSIDFVRARARKQPDCEGWTCGVLVQTSTGTIRDSAGLVQDGEKLVGGWAECEPKGWKAPMRLEVNLNGYIKKTATGQTTKFWSPENQPTMIAKVAEMQLLRRIWPAALGKMYLQEEVGKDDLAESLIYEMGPDGNGSAPPDPETPKDRFDALAREKAGNGDLDELPAFVTACAAASNQTDEWVYETAVKDFSKFWGLFQRSLKSKREKAEMAQAEAKQKKAGKDKGKPETAPPGPAQESQERESVNSETGEVEFPGPFDMAEDTRPDSTMIPCPNEGEGGKMALGFCRTNCKQREGCPSF